jgi:hypothetical protein
MRTTNTLVWSTQQILILLFIGLKRKSNIALKLMLLQNKEMWLHLKEGALRGKRTKIKFLIWALKCRKKSKNAVLNRNGIKLAG